jgi:uncharacterized delta-60 repeat protein
MNDGKVMIGGAFTIIDGKPHQYFARLNNDGSLDDTYSRDVPQVVTAILGQADGKVIIGGAFYDIGGTARHGLARLDASGNLDISFNFGGLALPSGTAPRVIKPQIDGGFLIMSSTATFRVTSAGIADTGFLSLSGNFKKLAEWNAGVLLAGNYINTQDLALARLTPNGHVDTNFVVAFGPAYSSTVSDFDFQPDGKIVVVGSFATVDGELRNGIARLNTSAAASSATLNIRLAPAITVSGAIGTQYRLEYATQLHDAIWSPLVDVVLTNSQSLFIDAEASGDTRFYRALALP